MLLKLVRARKEHMFPSPHFSKANTHPSPRKKASKGKSWRKCQSFKIRVGNFVGFRFKKVFPRGILSVWSPLAPQAAMKPSANLFLPSNYVSRYQNTVVEYWNIVCLISSTIASRKVLNPCPKQQWHCPNFLPQVGFNPPVLLLMSSPRFQNSRSREPKTQM